MDFGIWRVQKGRDSSLRSEGQGSRFFGLRGPCSNNQDS